MSDDYIPDIPRPVFIGPTWRRNQEGDFDLPELTLGWQVLKWIEENLVAEEVDDYGNPLPFRPTAEQKRFLLWWYSVDERGRFNARNGVFQRIKGAGKDPLASVIAAVEFLGPCRVGGWAARDMPELGHVRRGDPVGVEHSRAWVQVAAVSARQTQNTMKYIRTIFREETKARHGITKQMLGAEKITAHGGARSIEAVTSSPKSLEGARPTFLIANEALALDTPIPAPGGWTTMGDLRDGDKIFGRDGRPTTVTKAHDTQVGRRCFKVTFADDTSVVASDGHLWLTHLVGSAAKPKVRTTIEMAEDGRKFSVPRAKVRQTEAIDLPVDPYLLGAWLGDGSTGQPNITVGDDDLEELEAQFFIRGIKTHRLKKDKDRASRIGFSARGNGFGSDGGSGHGKALRALDCYLDKHIPEVYFNAGTEQRLELLRGLMDTDGCMTKVGAAIFVGRQRLCEDVLRLLRSLGQVARLTKQVDPRSREGATWRVGFTPADDIQPFAFARKCQLVRHTARANMTIKSIVEVDSVPVRCISVDAEDRLFQAGEGGHVTHNTHHWLENNGGHEMYQVIKRNAAKAKDGAARALHITNAYEPNENSVLQMVREDWEAERAEGIYDTGLLYDSIEMPSTFKMRPNIPEGTPAHVEGEMVRAHLAAAVTAVRGDAVWLDVEGIVSEILSARSATSVSIARRFWFNTIVASEDAWADHEATVAAVHPLARAEYNRPEHDTVRAGWGLISPDEPVVMFGDGSKSNDTTALVITRLSDGHKVLIGSWSRPSGERGKTWLTPREEVDARVEEAFKRFNIVGFWFDPSHTFDDDGGRYWDGMVDRWHRLYKDRLTHWAVKTGDSQHSVMWDMTSPQRTKEFTAAAERYIVDLENRDTEGKYKPRFTLDANPLLITHHDNARRYATSFGTSLSKINKDSRKKIDIAVCCVGSEMLARIVLNREEEEEDEGPGEVWGRW